MPRLSCLLFASILTLAVCSPVHAADAPAWAPAMRKVHERFTGRKGTFAQFGDSITVTLAYWAPLKYSRNNLSPAAVKAFAQVNGYMQDACWRDWKGPQYGSEGGQTIAWADEHIDAWLKKLNPEVALIMFGTNDLTQVPLDEYDAKMRVVVGKCLANGTIVILSTIPPRHGMLEKSRKYSDAVRKIAMDMKVPLLDFFGEIMKRRPNDWDGASEKFKDATGYEVNTLLSRDGVHPSFPKKFADDYSEAGLRNSGYTLRTYLTLMAYDSVIRAVLQNQT